jgi:hypothetical protein
VPEKGTVALSKSQCELLESTSLVIGLSIVPRPREFEAIPFLLPPTTTRRSEVRDEQSEVSRLGRSINQPS